MSQFYWAVVWGDEGDNYRKGPKQNGVIRMSTKCENAEIACRNCFGSVAKNMWTKNLGSSVAPIRSDKRRIELLDLNKGIWVRVGNNTTFKDGVVQ